MKPESSLPGQMGLSIGGESIPDARRGRPHDHRRGGCVGLVRQARRAGHGPHPDRPRRDDPQPPAASARARAGRGARSGLRYRWRVAPGPWKSAAPPLRQLLRGDRRAERDGQLQVADVAGCGGTSAGRSGCGHGGRRPAANVAADSSGGLLDADAQAELRGLALAAGRGAIAVGRGAVAGPLGAAVAGALLPTPTAMDDRPLAMCELAKARGDTGGLAASTGLDGARARQGRGPGSLEAERGEGSDFTTTAPSGQLKGMSVPAPLPPLPGLTPPAPLPPPAEFTPGTPLDRPSVANAQVHIAPEVRAASNILERNELCRRMERGGQHRSGRGGASYCRRRRRAEWRSRSNTGSRRTFRSGSGSARPRRRRQTVDGLP